MKILRKIGVAIFAATLMTNSAVNAAQPRPMHYTGKIVPTPQQVTGKWEFLPISPKSFSVVTDNDAHNAIQLAKYMVMEQLERFKAKGKPEGKVTVFLGNLTDEVIRIALAKYNVKLNTSVIPKENKEGYFIRIVRDGKNTIVIAAGTGHRGTFYAAMTLLQSIGIADEKLIIHCANINDWPVWETRYMGEVTVPDSKYMLDYFGKYKINGLAIQYQRAYEWRDMKPTGSYMGQKVTWGEKLKNLKKLNDKYDLFDYMFGINIYSANPRKYPYMDISKEKDIKELIKVCSFIADMGFDNIMILADDHTPSQKGEYVFPNKSEAKHFGNSIGRAHGYLMKRLYNALKEKYPKLKLAFCPAPYSIYVHDVPGNPSHQRYLKDMGEEIPDEVSVVWTGPQVRSRKISKKDYELFAKYCNGHKNLWVFDNSCGPMPISRWDTVLYDGFHKDSNGIIFINTFAFSWGWHTPFVIGTNDYLWNPKAYNATTSYNDVIDKMFGKGMHKPVEKYIETYKMLEAGDKDADFRDIELALEQMEKLKFDIRKPARAAKQLKAKFNAKVPSLKVVKFKTPPVIDGKIDDKCWGKANEFKFTSYDKNKKVEPTWGKIGHDGKNLYIAFRLDYSKAQIDPKITHHDGSVFLTDACEIFLQGEKPGSYAHLSFDHKGNKHDESDLGKIKLSWDPAWEVAVKNSKGNWTAEVKIPFSSMTPVIEIPVGKGTIWRANFCRSYTSEAEFSCWSPTYGNLFKTTEFFGRLIFE
jgi:hypothetical protein